jgi:hypothetical protein
LENIFIAIISAMATVIVAILGLLGSRKLNPKRLTNGDQSKLINTLKDTLAVQVERIKLLETAHQEQVELLGHKEEELRELRERVSRLEQLTIEQALLITQLQVFKRRGRPRNEGGDLQPDEHDRS